MRDTSTTCDSYSIEVKCDISDISGAINIVTTVNVSDSTRNSSHGSKEYSDVEDISNEIQTRIYVDATVSDISMTPEIEKMETK